MPKKIECRLHEKIESGQSLSEEDYKFLSEIVKEVLTFMAQEKIIPSPQNYERWFKIFCYVKEKGLNLSKAELIDLYLDTFQSGSDNNKLSSVNLVEKIAEELFEDVQKLLKNVSEHQKGISQSGDRLEELSSSITTLQGDMQKILSRIITEVKGLKNLNRKFIKRLEEQKEEIARLRQELRKVKEEANIDPLTGLRNRRSFERALKEFFRDYKRFGYPFALIMFDIDNFKNINDTYGHLAGDKVLKEIGRILRSYLRAKDVVARTGGEEFTIILPGVSKEEAVAVAERLRKIISNHSVDFDGNKINVTASFGVTEMREEIEEPEELLREADEKLYTAKRTGKDKVVA